MENKNNTIKTTYREALKQALRDGLINDNRTFLMGEDVGRYGGAFAVSKGLLQEFGPERIIDVPLSESGFVGTGIGAAIGGMKPIIEIMTVNFSLLAMDQIINNAATLFHMSGGQVNVPLIIRINTGVGGQLAAQHSHSWEPFFAAIPGLKVLSVSTHEDARSMLLAALQESNPFIIFEYTYLLNTIGEIPVDTKPADLQHAKIRREGNDISIITYGSALYPVLEAAEILSKEGIESEIVDLRLLRPIDEETIISSVSKTGRAVIVENAWKSISISSEISSRIMEKAFYKLKAPVERICGIEVPIPYSKHLEEACIPRKEQILDTVKDLFQHA